MTIKQAIEAVDTLKPNSYTDAQKVAWLSELDTSVYWQLVRKVNPNGVYTPSTTYNTGDIVFFANLPYVCQADGVTDSPQDAPDSWAEETWTGYDANDEAYDADTELLAPVPYDILLYTSWLFMQMDLFNREIDQYNNHALLYNTAWDDLARHLIRTFMPIQDVTHFRM